MDNFINVEFAAKSENESFSRLVAAAFASLLDPTVSELSDIKTAVSEAVTNCIVHAYKGGSGTIYLSMYSSGRCLYFTVTDKGCGMENIEEAMQPLYTSSADSERSGMGFTVMQSFMDSLSVSSEPGKGTTVKMSKEIGL